MIGCLTQLGSRYTYILIKKEIETLSDNKFESLMLTVGCTPLYNE